MDIQVHTSVEKERVHAILTILALHANDDLARLGVDIHLHPVHFGSLHSRQHMLHKHTRT